MKANDNVLSISFWQESFSETFFQFKTALINYVPKLLAAILILVVGWFLAKVAGFIGRKIGKVIFHFILAFERKLQVKVTKENNNFSNALGAILYWLFMVYFLFFALKILDLPGISDWLGHLVTLIPKIVSAIIIIFLGCLVAIFARGAIYASFSEKEDQDPYFISQIAKFGIIAIFVILGVGQIGVDITILTNFISIILAAIVGGAALGFGMGASAHVANLVATYNLKRHFIIGEKIIINNIEGTIIDITNTSLILESEEGQVVIPAKLTNEMVSVKRP